MKSRHRDFRGHRWSSERHADTGEPGQLGISVGQISREVLGAPVKLRVARLHMEAALASPEKAKEQQGKDRKVH